MKRLTQILLLISFIVNFMLPIINNWSKINEKFDPNLYEKKYNNSQYVIPNSKNPISDEDLLAYAGYRYTKGLNPILINSDHPPLGKYIIGVIILLTGKHKITSFIFAILNILLFYLILKKITNKSELINLGLTFIFLDSMFIDQIIHSPILDIIQLFFFLAFLLFFILFLKYKNFFYIVLIGITLGCFSSVKIYFPSFILFTTISFSLLYSRKYHIKKIFYYLVVILIISVITYILTYFRYFQLKNNFLSFLKVQKWIFLFWSNNSVREEIFYGNALTLILFNKWKIWWGEKNFINYENWNILWPIFFTSGFFISIKRIIFSLRNFFKEKITLHENIIFFLTLWVFIYTIYLNLLPISPRYLLILFFPIYLVIILEIKKNEKRFFKK